ncbi:MAG: YifB family Mg chelatase-like AAA ATPase [Actinomycetota bacterium]
MLASIATFALTGVDSREVTVEVDVRRGLPAFTVVGLPDTGVREARERVRAALLNSGLEFPLQRITANLAPASMRKAGTGFDLALAVGVLVASGQVPAGAPDRTAVCGELSLGGVLRPVRGALAGALGARAAGYERLVVAVENAEEAALAGGLEVLPVPSLTRLVGLLRGRWRPDPPATRPATQPGSSPLPDLADVRGQQDAKRALEIAAAGGHNLLMVGPPGAGKTMTARRLPGILPPPSFDEALEITRIRGAAGLGDGRLARERPFRAPHHTTSPQGLVGGGPVPRPGEITLAHRGVLFLDEIAEFSRAALESLRQPLEDGVVEIIRGQRSLAFPSRAMLVAACNPCPCARGAADCRCNEVDRLRYARRLSGPLLDRIDLICEVQPPPAAELVARVGAAERSAAVRDRVVAARERQARRLAGDEALCNGHMDGRATRRHAVLGARGTERLLGSVEAGTLTGRGHDRVLRLARTIADLAGRERIVAGDVEEALGYRLVSPVEIAA